jgi:hypothetical protein
VARRRRLVLLREAPHRQARLRHATFLKRDVGDELGRLDGFGEMDLETRGA